MYGPQWHRGLWRLNLAEKANKEKANKLSYLSNGA